jgi:hypothetical protein
VDVKGELEPVVLVPRFTSFIGSGSFTTAPLNLEPYSRATITIWRGYMPGTASPTFKIYFEDSHDAETWTAFNPSGESPSAVTPAIVTCDLIRRWFRARVDLTGTNTGVTCWAVGLLEKRV